MSESLPPAPPPDGGGGNPPAPPNPAGAPFVITKDEWVDFRRENRAIKEQLAKLTQPAASAEPAKPAAAPPTPKEGESAALARVTELEFKLSVKDAIQSAGITDVKFARLIEQAARAEKPTDLNAFVAEYAAVAPAKQPVAAPAAAAAVLPPTNTGPAAPTVVAPALPADPTKWPEEAVRSAGPVGFMTALKAYQASQQGRGWNPYGQIKRPHDK